MTSEMRQASNLFQKMVDYPTSPFRYLPASIKFKFAMRLLKTGFEAIESVYPSITTPRKEVDGVLWATTEFFKTLSKE